VRWLQLAWHAVRAVVLVRYQDMLLAEVHVIACWRARLARSGEIRVRATWP
jgi:hypothetical protein